MKCFLFSGGGGMWYAFVSCFGGDVYPAITNNGLSIGEGLDRPKP